MSNCDKVCKSINQMVGHSKTVCFVSISIDQNFSRQRLRTKEQFQKHTCHPTNRFILFNKEHLAGNGMQAQSTVHSWQPREIVGR